jgi:hypothetical protein
MPMARRSRLVGDTELRLVITESLAVGSALATSDAALERDPAMGQLREFRRAWELRALRAPCDSIPQPAL